MGENRLAISSYYLCVEDEIIILPPNISAIEAFDYLFKAHYIFNQDFDYSTKTFFNFVASYFYKIESTDSKILRIKEIYSKLELEISNHN